MCFGVHACVHLQANPALSKGCLGTCLLGKELYTVRSILVHFEPIPLAVFFEAAASTSCYKGVLAGSLNPCQSQYNK